MEELVVTLIGYLRLAIEAVGAGVVAFGVLATTFQYVTSLLGLREYTNLEMGLYLGRYLVLSLEFQLAANILSTAMHPTLGAVLLLGAIVVIRTTLSYFLSRELEREREHPPPAPERDALHSQAAHRIGRRGHPAGIR